VLAPNVIVEHPHWSGPEEGEQGDDVIETIEPDLLREFSHAGAFQLKHPDRVGAVEEVEGRFVIERDPIP